MIIMASVNFVVAADSYEQITSFSHYDISLYQGDFRKNVFVSYEMIENRNKKWIENALRILNKRSLESISHSVSISSPFFILSSSSPTFQNFKIVIKNSERSLMTSFDERLRTRPGKRKQTKYNLPGKFSLWLIPMIPSSIKKPTLVLLFNYHFFRCLLLQCLISRGSNRLSIIF